EVLRIARSSSGWRVGTSVGEVSAGEVLVATNGYTGEAVPWLMRRLVPIGSYVIATEPLDRSLADGLIPRRRMTFDSKHFLYYFRTTDDGRLLFGGRAEFGRPTPDATERAATILRRGLTTIFPQLAGARIAYAWSGNVAFTRDQMPCAGRLNGMWFAAGYGGHGIAMATC